MGSHAGGPAGRLTVAALDGARILVVEDDPALRRVVGRGLEMHGSRVIAAADGRSAMSALDSDGPFDAHIIDIGLPDADGRDVSQALRARGIAGPVIFLTALGHVADLVSAFAAGADDYIAKPFEFPELLVRLDALLRRSGTPALGMQVPAPIGSEEVALGSLREDVRLDPLTHAMTSGSRSAALTPTEYRILAALIAAPGRVVRRRELVRSAWPDGAIVQDNTLDQYIARLRRKLAGLSVRHTVITAHGVGYRYE